MLLPRTNDRSMLMIVATPLLAVFTHACGYPSRTATISFAELQVRLLYEGGYYSGCGFYSNKYGTLKGGHVNTKVTHMNPHLSNINYEHSIHAIC